MNKLLLLFTFLQINTHGQSVINSIAKENKETKGVTDFSRLISHRDPTIQGFSTEISTNKGNLIYFKINTYTEYKIEIYRLGFYNGKGARKVAEIGNLKSSVQVDCTPDQNYPELIDCSCWKKSAEWLIPKNAVSGVYLAYLKSSNNTTVNYILFIVRDDKTSSDLLFKTSDPTWQAYNRYKNRCFYPPTPPKPPLIEEGKQVAKVSYNRPIITSAEDNDYFFVSEYRMVRWLERNGYNVKYCSALDIARWGIDSIKIKNEKKVSKIILSVGHDEYWSLEERQYFEIARSKGVHLAFFSGNECYWKTRWENNCKTLVCYKEGTEGDYTCGSKCDKATSIWTGLWRSKQGEQYDAGRPESLLSGQLSVYGPAKGSSNYTINVPREYWKSSFWRKSPLSSFPNTEINYSLKPDGILGYEWDWEIQDDYKTDNRYIYPERQFLSYTEIVGNVYGKPHNVTHHLTIYSYETEKLRSLIFGAGTTNWSWGLDNLNGKLSIDLNVQQATANLFYDMGEVKPKTPQKNLKNPKP